MKKLFKSIKIEVAALLGAGVLATLNSTLKWKKGGDLSRPDFGQEGGGPRIFLFWHNRQLMIPFIYRLLGPIPKEPAVTLISMHSDGRMIARAVDHLGLGSVAGSSSRGAVEGFMQLADNLKAGVNVGITPDGPRGPLYKVKAGAVKLAQLSGRPVCAVAYGASRKWVSGSWDRMVLPKPFSKTVAVVGEPLLIPAELNTQEFEDYRQRLENELNRVTALADNWQY